MQNPLIGCNCVIFITLLAVPAAAQPAPAASSPATGQRDSVAAMQESLARQRASIQRQTGAAGNDSFFVLPRAASLGGVTAALPAPVSSAPIALECEPLPAPQVDSLVGQAAEREGVSPDLLRSVMKQESAFRPCAVSSKGAMGLMQLMPATAEQLGILDPFDATSNLNGGAKFLRQLLDKYSGDIPKALGAYNAGPEKVDAAGAVPNIPETMDYVRQILAALPFH
ncbi:MAG TPA: lytic transglycosylase domain-containing protein [Bryobacteraceae bacterium]|nr:lytic transglycosylase domain-containing protein [Bryobacteraceae bacterium]